MTWSHFTAYLDGSRPITKAERDELYTQLQGLLVGGCVSAGYSLNSSDQTAITGSGLLTDRASLDRAATNTRARLHTILATAAAAFTNYTTAETAALAGESITSAQRDTIIAAAIDDHRLWNYYRRLIDALACCQAPDQPNAWFGGTVGTALSYNTPASGTAPITYSATGLPPGLAINASNGQITGTPTAAGTYAATITATNACGSDSATFTIVIGIPSAPNCDFLGVGGFADSADGGPCLDETFSVTGQFTYATLVHFAWSGGDQIEWEVRANGTTIWTSGCVGGFDGSDDFTVPAGTTSLRILANCGCGVESASFTYTIECPTPCTEATVTGATVNGIVDTAFSYQVAAAGSAPITYSATGLPPGLSINTSTGAITGTPTMAGTYNATITVENACGEDGATLTIVIAEECTAATVADASASGSVGAAFAYNIAAAGTVPITYGATGLPPGLSLNTSTGAITGTPTTAGTYNATISVENDCGDDSAALTITIAAACESAAIANATVYGEVNVAFSRAGSGTGTAPLTYSATGLPPGLSINTSTGAITGTPTTAGSYPVTLTVSNACGESSATLMIWIEPYTHAPDLTAEAEGGAGPYSASYPLRSGGPLVADATLDITFDAFTRKDRIIVDVDGTEVYDSGCVAGSCGASVTVPTGAERVNVTIIAECDPAQTSPATGWIYTLSCVS
jgi:PKD repeat protein